MLKVQVENQAKVDEFSEVRNFLGKKGPEYARTSATTEEKKHFEGSIYHAGVPDLAFISYITSPSNPY